MDHNTEIKRWATRRPTILSLVPDYLQSTDLPQRQEKRKKRQRTYEEWFREIQVRFCGSACQPPRRSAEAEARQRLLKGGVPLVQEEEVRRMLAAGSVHLGEGTYGSCLRAVDPHTGRELVVKSFAKKDLRELVVEALTLRRLQVEGVQGLVGVCVETRQLVTPFAGVTADQYLKTAPRLADVVSVALQVARTLQRVVRRGYTHNDLKENNVCVSVRGGAPVATLIDLGLARRVGTRGLFGAPLEPRRFPWIAPECLQGTHPCGEASEVFGAAFLLHKLGLREARRPCPAMAALAAWQREARRPHPAGRPALAELIRLLEALHAHV